ncbi:PspC domain-containing protein [Pedobacter sp. SYSU D00535]|uniref:PspC domain-containing protein n=1 Tax=Pedobacter sp. SYSU D00535 TaxID=2810308 RepID=UPI001A96FEE4|nr:PspC domain-containing protein [Pedobacter sp. SYSU D00535]
MEKKLERDEANKMIAGVAAGLADYMHVEVTWVRVLFLLAAIFGFAGVWVYLILWIAVPAKSLYSGYSAFDTDYKVFSDQSRTYQDPVVKPGYEPTYVKEKRGDSGRLVAGIALIVVGGFFLLREFNIIPHWFSVAKLWPLIFIIIGLIMLATSGKKNKVIYEPKNDIPAGDNPVNSNDKPGDQPLA